MILKALAVAAVALGVSAAPPPKITSYTFLARVGYRNGDGRFTPVMPDSVWIGRGERGCEPENQSEEDLSIYPDGFFPLTIFELYTYRHWFRDDGTEGGEMPPIIEWPCYRFHVEGCDDRTILFGPTPPGSNIELNCPGDSTVLRHDV